MANLEIEEESVKVYQVILKISKIKYKQPIKFRYLNKVWNRRRENPQSAVERKSVDRAMASLLDCKFVCICIIKRAWVKDWHGD